MRHASLGTFVDELSGRGRTVITSASEKNAFYDLDGRLSFTQFLADAIGQGHSLKEGFKMAAERLKRSNKPFNIQEPWMDDDGDSQANGSLDGFAADKILVGAPFLIGDIAPETLEHSKDMSIRAGASVTFFAKVSHVEEMKNVWATVTPPDFVTLLVVCCPLLVVSCSVGCCQITHYGPLTTDSLCWFNLVD